MSNKFSDLEDLLVLASDWHTGYVLPWSTDTVAALEDLIISSAKRLTGSALDSRIETGDADPITPEERELVAGLRKYYEKKFGKN